MATQQKYYEDYYKQGKERLDKVLTEKEANNKQYVDQVNSAIDKAAQTAASGYQQSIDEAPIAALEQKEKNAMAEAVNRKIVEENMANMGLTDSGLNRTQQTALTLQRGNADAAVDQQTQEYVNKLKMAIDEVMTEAETQKVTNEAAALKETRDWYEAALTQLESSASSAAAEAYAADKKAEADSIQAQYEAIARSDEYRNAYVDSLMENGYSENAAWAAAYARYPSQDKEQNKWAIEYANAYNSAKNGGYDNNYANAIASAIANGENADDAVLNTAAGEVKRAGIDVEDMVKIRDALNPGGKWHLFKTPAGQAEGWKISEWEDVIGNLYEVAEKKLEGKTGSLSLQAKEYAIGYAIGQIVGDYSSMSKREIYNVLAENLYPVEFKAACIAAGINYQ